MSEHATGAKPPENELEQLTAQLLKLMGLPPEGDSKQCKGVRGIAARIFRCGMGVGWDKYQAMLDCIERESRGNPIRNNS